MPAPPRIRRDDASLTPLRVAQAEFTRDASSALRADAAARIDRDPHLVVDLAAVAYIDMVGVGTLFHLYRIATARGGSLRVLNVGPRAFHRLRISGLPQFAAVEPSSDSR